jgi:trimethylamine:corrinoid methyltransferase-like protein
MFLLPTVQVGVHLELHAAGALEGGLLASYEKFAMDVEILRMFERILERGAAATPEGLDRAAHQGWRALLASYEDPGIDRGMDEELRRHVAVRQQEIRLGGG